MIIIFVGPPGSGKTTQMYLLSKILSNRGKRVKILCLKRGFLASFIERVLILLVYGKCSRHPYPLEILLRGAKDKLKKIISLWYTINTFELVARLLMLIAMSKMLKLVLLIEEYIPAIITDYIYVALRLKIPIDMIANNINILVHTYLKAYPLKAIVLTASIQELVCRWRKRGRAEHSRTYILIQRITPNLVKMLTWYPNKEILIIDTTYKPILDTLKTLTYNIHV